PRAHRAFGRSHRQGGAYHRRRAVHLYESEPFHRSAVNTAGSDYDVVILGAGLIGLALAVALARQGLGIALLERSSLAAFADAARITLADGRNLRARLVIGADGVRSWIRREAGIAREPRSYGQTAIVANFAAERTHRGRAFQWFVEDAGVLAWLPLPGRRISIVWSAPDALAQELLALDAAALGARVEAAGGLALGALTPITPPAAFPLSFLRLASPVAHR